MKWIRTRPKPIEETEYNFPKNIEAVYQSKENFNYFFRKNEYCKRKSDDNNKVCLRIEIDIDLNLKLNRIDIDFSARIGYQTMNFLDVILEKKLLK